MSGAELIEALAINGLTGWKASVHPNPMAPGRVVAALTSPDFVPHASGRLIVRQGRDPADAFALAVEAARGPAQ